MPVAISYHGSGIRTRQEASSVGLGWSLEVGGVITRTVLGLPDESPLGYNSSFPLFNPGDQASVESAAQNGHDLHPDIYSFRVMGYSGKFCLDHNGNCILLEDSEVKIEHITGGGNNYWQILTPDGTKYIFNEIEEGFIAIGGGSNIVAATSWLLTEIYSVNDLLEFKLVYSEQSTSFSNNYFSGTKFIVTANSCSAQSCSVNCDPYCGDLVDQFNVSIGTQKYKTLDTILTSSNTYNLVFAYSSRSDLTGAKKLDKISLVDQSDVEVYSQNFSYSHFGPGTARLKLDSVIKSSINDSIPPYIFSYNPMTVDKTTGSFDHWGFPNNNSASGQFPPSEISDLEQVFNGDQCFGFPARDPDTMSLEGMLKKIIFPTGGYEEYVWENHQFGAIRDTSETVSPSYVTQNIYLNTTPSQTVTSSNFNITPEYPVIKMDMDAENSSSCPALGSCFAYFRIYDANTNVLVYQYTLTDDDQVIQYVILGEGTYYLEISRDPSSNVPLHYVEATLSYHERDMTQAVLGLQAGGCRIKSIKNNDGIRSFTYSKTDTFSSGVLLFAPKYHYSQSYIKRCSSPVDCTGATCTGNEIHSNNTISSLSGDHIFYTRILEILPDSSMIEYIYDYHEDVDNFDWFPKQPYLSRYQLRGQLLEKNYFQWNDSIHNLIKKEEYQYSDFPTESVQGYSVGIIKNFPGCSDPVDAEFNSFAFSGFRKVLDTLKVTLDGVATTTAYSYSSAYETVLKSEEMINSNGDVYTTTYHYPDDYPNVELMTSLQDENRIIPPWQTLKKTNSTTVDGTKTLYGYADVNGVVHVPNGSNSTSEIYPRDVYRYHYTWDESGTPIVDAWQPECMYTEYSLTHGLLEKKLLNGWSDTLKIIWDANANVDSVKFISHSLNFDYNGTTQLISSTAIDGQITNYSYDGLLRLDTISERDGKLVTSYTYLYNPNRIKTISSFDGLSDRTIIQDFDSLGRIQKIIKKNYNESGQDVESTTTYNNKGQIHTYSDFENNTTTYSYYKDPLNRVQSIIDPMGFKHLYEYGTNTNEVAGYNASSLFKSILIDPDSLITEVYLDKREREIMSRKSNGILHADTYHEYDSKDRIRTIIPPDATINDAGLIYEYVYDGEDKILSQRIPDRGQTQYLYDLRDLRIGIKDSLMISKGKTWLISTYDDYGRIKKTGFGFLLGIPIVSEKLIENFYDGEGTGNQAVSIYKGKKDKSIINILEQYGKGPIDIIKEYEFETYGRISKEDIINPLIGNSVNNFTYDMSDNIISEQFNTPIGNLIYTRAYDNYGRLDSITINRNGVLENTLINIEYDNNDNIVKRHIRDGYETVNYSYNANNWLTQIKLDEQNFVVDTSCFLSNPDMTLFEYNLFYNGPGGAISSPLRKNGTISGITWKQGGFGNFAYGFEYDFLNRLTKATSLDNNAYGTEYTYLDKRGNFESINRNGYVLDDSCYNIQLIDSLLFNYSSGTNCIDQVTDSVIDPDCPDYEYLTNVDRSGNYGTNKFLGLRGLVKQGQSINFISDSISVEPGFEYSPYNFPDTIGTGSITILLDTCPNNNLIQTVKGTQHGFKENGALSYEYDENGNLVYHADKNIFLEYNYLNLPFTATDSTNSISWIYTAEGEKIKRLTSIDTFTYEKHYFGKTELDEGDTLVFYEDGQLRIREDEWIWEYNIRDHLANTRLIFTRGNTLDSIRIIQNNNYYPFGMRLYGEWDNLGNNLNEYLYNDKELEKDLELNWYYYGARYYDPSIGRFTGVDPLADSYSSFSPYNYVLNNPIKLVDPDGMAPENGGDGSAGRVHNVRNTRYLKGEISEKQFIAQNKAHGQGGLLAASIVSPVDDISLTVFTISKIPAVSRALSGLAKFGDKIVDGVKVFFKNGDDVPTTTIADPGLGNQFKDKTVDEVNGAMQKHVDTGKLEEKYTDPVSGSKSYQNTESGYSYNVDTGKSGKTGAKVEPSHIDVNYPKPKPKNIPKKKLPIKD